jgi:hopene-associated glycosyltransferase HpnB
MTFLADLARLDLTALTLLSLAAWLYLSWGRSDFWKADSWLRPVAPSPALPETSVAVVIPARNEVETIARTVGSLSAQDLSGQMSIFVVDDQSTDGTAEAARGAATNSVPLTVLSGTDLPPGWSGKVWAMAQGVEAATAGDSQPDYVLFTDADIHYRPGILDKMVRRAQHDNLTFVSLMARLDARGLWGKLLIPAFIYFFQLIYPFARANTRYDTLAAAAGGCFLVRRETLDAIGGVAAIKGEIIDDCALATALKQARPAHDTLTALTHDVWSLRDNRSLGSIWNMVARTAFTQLGHSWLALAGVIAGLIITFIIPLWAVLMGLTGQAPAIDLCLGAAAWALMSWTYRPTVKLYGLGLPWAASLPGAAVIYVGATIASALRHARGSGARWKGRSYAQS